MMSEHCRQCAVIEYLTSMGVTVSCFPLPLMAMVEEHGKLQFRQ